jgi:deoxyribodipyrimidine photo-lyase
MTTPETLLPKSRVPTVRVRPANAAPVRPDGEYVLYWMIAARRTHYNFGLERAAEWARALGRPLLVLEALRVGYPWASDRLHAFVLQGMADNARRLESAGVTHLPYVERARGEGQGLLAALARRAAVVVTDDFPAFFLPRMVEAAGKQVPVLLEQVDSNGLLPIHAPDRVFPVAKSFRTYLHKNLLPHLKHRPLPDPLKAPLPSPQRALLPSAILSRWPRAEEALLAAEPGALAALPIDHHVGVVRLAGGEQAGRKTVRHFVEEKLARYEDDRNDPDRRGTSGLSPYYHFGHISAHEVFAQIEKSEGWSEDKVNPSARGSREGFWGMSGPAEAFLDEAITWREIGLNMCALRPHDYMSFDSLPAFALRTLAEHESDPRPVIYTREEIEEGRTGDRVWNAAQRELLREGRIHNYMRMVWGKRLLEWRKRPEEALALLIEINDRWALDGRDPNTYSGIFWVFGRYDRAWGPERPIYGTVRYMSSANTERKLDLKEYLAEYADRPLDAEAPERAPSKRAAARK